MRIDPLTPEELEDERRYEQDRYSKLYRCELRTRPEKKWYGIRNHGKEAWPLIEKLGLPKSIADIGCGNGFFPRQCVASGIKDVFGS